MEMLFLIVVISTDGVVIAYFTFLQANNVSIVVCSSFLTSSNMSKNCSIPGYIPLQVCSLFSVPFILGTGDGGE